MFFFFFFQAEDGIRDIGVTGVQTCALPIYDSLETNFDIQVYRKNVMIVGSGWTLKHIEGITDFQSGSLRPIKTWKVLKSEHLKSNSVIPEKCHADEA